ncbi:5'/3'-nucleotidase SurE [Pararhodospirillum oryzae]|uniref:5'-nucleotidase SurE n=1 Tax=Pararhodospirillum oryzae TaxID=478448 RepID=A0A512H3W3_9PROT|nr:5'/3'-nucleotidase SurE [Pararhodospirillum oryzae]GEO80159.1 5'-nucleotidase SurE [Pararhodospirillum oryzae]
MFPPLTDLGSARILVSNDDGIDAEGLALLERVARTLSNDVWVVAPERERSGAGHALTLHDPLRLIRHGERRFAVSGTPTDCVLVAVNHLLKDRAPDLVLSGINRGGNLGEDVHYSGTVAAALEGTLLGFRAIALSQVIEGTPPQPFAAAEALAPDLIRRACARPWARNVLINVNFPSCAPEAVAGVELVRQGKRKIGDQIQERFDPRGRPYMWIGPQRNEDRFAVGTDLEAVCRNVVTVTPLGVDMTHEATLASLAGAF